MHPSCYRLIGSMAEPSGVRGHPLSCGRTICDAWAEGHDAGQVEEAKRHEEAARLIPEFGAEFNIERVAEDYEKSRKELYKQAVDLDARAKALEAKLVMVMNTIDNIQRRAYGIEVPEIEMLMGNRLQAIGLMCDVALDALRVLDEEAMKP
jgi:hypothetical protein